MKKIQKVARTTTAMKKVPTVATPIVTHHNPGKVVPSVVKKVPIVTPKPATEDYPSNSVLARLGPRPPGATVLQYRRPPMKLRDGSTDPGTLIVVPYGAYGDFSSFTVGEVRWGKMRGPDEETDFVPVNATGQDLDRFDQGPPKVVPKVQPQGATETDLPESITKPKRAPSAGGKREGVCAFIDALILKGGKTAEQIRDLAVKQFPGRDPNATLSTVRVRPTHMRAKGLTPPPFKK